MTLLQIIVASITGIAAITGMVLSIVNTIHRIRQDKVRLKVTPKLIPHACDWASVNLGIEVTNLSTFPVKIVDVGLVFKDRKREDESIVYYIRHESEPEPEIPVELLPRKIMVWEHPLGPWDATDSIIFASVKHAYAGTEYGDKIRGESKEFRKRCRRFKRVSRGIKKKLPHLSQPEE